MWGEPFARSASAYRDRQGVVLLSNKIQAAARIHYQISYIDTPITIWEAEQGIHAGYFNSARDSRLITIMLVL
ncbi:MAG: hypothetical protein GFH27_549297n86 [Chloroflexi bacterium AL-W]|nr:hypothetical protein [Chloroflexi bacterium AL-N1]NOK68610.1 hypothetical protein [Chloroflexi bacterium AL-N10]NOK76096.1 hypothetical protein [Chloroflexi bacterium AL-N5]NOK82569.1 hypothetical protein [Chloroflexi bacterium AL-W]NOK93367.1 hypothetical protein [Chloroflexi bacterium AL-N15]